MASVQRPGGWKRYSSEEVLSLANVTHGYFHRPEATEKAFDEEGWSHTRDVGRIDQEEFLEVHDRIDNVFKTAGGKFVEPQSIQNRLKQSFLICHELVLGKDRKMVTALIALDFENLETWVKEHDMRWQGRQWAVSNDRIRRRFQRLVEEKNEGLDLTEKVKKFRLVSDKWTVQTGELTPTMKVKREQLIDRYQELIDEMYA